MSEALDLIRAVLGDATLAEDKARQVLDAALAAKTDPLIYCSSAHAIDQTIAMERAAAWVGCAFFDKVPVGLSGKVEPTRLEALAGVRLFRMPVLDREIAFAAPDFSGLLRLKRRLAVDPGLRASICLLPAPALRDYLTSAASDTLIVAARQRLTRRWPYATAQLELTRPARYAFVAFVIVLLMIILVAPFLAELWLLPVALSLLVAPAILRFAAVFTPRAAQPVSSRPADEDLPPYSILIPLRNEAEMVPQLFAAMWALDYPATRLDIKFVVETTSSSTLEAVRSRLGDPRVSLVPVPAAAPLTKPKALDYALPLCTGQFVVVYDAEDIPDPDQLWKAVVRFRADPALVCLQAELLIDNTDRNWFTTLFAGEYAGLFSVMLPALARWGLPMPLGGTSNHFRLRVLRETGGWDAFNVTEDADIGLRLARRRLRVGVLASTTREHAPTQLPVWLGQRTRWMKGWMQTFIVHNANPRHLFADLGIGPALAFEVLVLGMILSPLLHFGLIIGMAVQLAHGGVIFHQTGWGAFYASTMALGYGSTLAITIMGLARGGRLHLLPLQILQPIYWLLTAFATLRALRELVVRPFHWIKTPHTPVGEVPTSRHPVAQPSKMGRRWPAPSK